MKFNLSLALLVSAVIAHGDEHKEAACSSTVECKLNELLKDAEFIKKVKECAKGDDATELQRCALINAGLTKEQVQAAAKVYPATVECAKEPAEQAKKCVAECKEDKKCLEKCEQESQAAVAKCLATKAKTPNFDFKKSTECSKKCTEEKEFTKLFDCDYTCNEELYKGLGADLKVVDNKDDKKEGGDKKESGDKKEGGEKKEEKKEEKKPTSNANRVQFGSLNLVAFALPLAYLFFN